MTPKSVHMCALLPKIFFCQFFSHLRGYLHESTRMHSSRMRTARTLTISPSTLCSEGYLVPGGVPGPGGCTWSQEGCTWSRGEGYLVPEGSWCTWSRGGDLVRYSPLVDRMTHASENITLPQTSFAGGKNITL